MRKIFTFLFAALMSVGMWAEPITVTWNSADMPSSGNANSFTLDGVTITCGGIGIDWGWKDFQGNGTFTTDLGNFTKIEVTAEYCEMAGEGWSGNSEKMTWTGNASSVSYNGSIMGCLSIVFTIEPASTPEPEPEPAGDEITVTWNDYDLPSSGSGNSFTKDGVTITCGGIEWEDLDFYNGGTFTTDLGNFTKIEVYAGWVTTPFGEGWSGSNERQTWTGNASSVSFSGEFMSAGEEVNLTFTIEPSGGEPTAVENVQSDKAQSTKILRDGQLLIEKNGKIYNVMGAEVK